MTRANAAACKMGHWKKENRLRGLKEERGTPKILKGHQGYWATGRKDTQWPQKAGVQVFVGDRFQLKARLSLLRKAWATNS